MIHDANVECKKKVTTRYHFYYNVGFVCPVDEVSDALHYHDIV